MAAQLVAGALLALRIAVGGDVRAQEVGWPTRGRRYRSISRCAGRASITCGMASPGHEPGVWVLGALVLTPGICGSKVYGCSGPVPEHSVAPHGPDRRHAKTVSERRDEGTSVGRSYPRWRLALPTAGG